MVKDLSAQLVFRTRRLDRSEGQTRVTRTFRYLSFGLMCLCESPEWSLLLPSSEGPAPESLHEAFVEVNENPKKATHLGILTRGVWCFGFGVMGQAA